MKSTYFSDSWIDIKKDGNVATTNFTPCLFDNMTFHSHMTRGPFILEEYSEEMHYTSAFGLVLEKSLSYTPFWL